MLQNTLSIIKQNILNNKLTPNKADIFIKLLSRYDNKRNKYIYPGVIIRHLGITMREAYLILNEIEQLKIIEKVYEVFCPKCKYSTGNIYNSISEIPDEYNCDECETEFQTLDGVIILYKVITE
ncbi:hypothetical protein [Metabacillus idriensis]|uniref:hypothetical protein n=1 Tax=Metabacillus idriensis TaxID=324768 RepID=UPI00174C708B|nr:hypothetical protein [Metabacillus idriensis]